MAACLVLIGLLGTSIPLRAPASDTAARYGEARDAIANLTGRPFRDTVPVKPQSRENFRRYVERSLNRTYGEGELDHLNTLYYLLGLFPPDYPLRRRLLKFYEQQAGAYYDPGTKSIRTLMEGLPPASRHFIYLHELVHAQQDQYFDLGSRMRRIRANRSMDRRLAFQFVIEGHANLVATASRAGAKSLSASFFQSEEFGRVITIMARLTGMDPSRFNLLARSLLPEESGMLARSLRDLEQVPWILVQQLMDPYFLGQKRWLERGRRLGWKKAESWLETPPRSTRAVLYENPDTGIVPPDPKDPPGRVRYRNRPGLYLFLRWLDRLADRPAWGRGVAAGPARILETPDDHLVAWSMGTNDTAGREILATLTAALTPGDTRSREPGQFVGREGRRYLRVEERPSGIILWFDDDPNMPRGTPWERIQPDEPARPAVDPRG